ncbi:hypothetical protein FDECE_8663 [Fusarium decemcellulare]|nr:hypothetical protein FDECE_8663 [Fusarium decemcellulare]
MRNIFSKSYTLLPPEDQATLDHLGINWINDEYRGTSGPAKVSFSGIIQNPICKAWVDAFRGLGQATTSDPFSGNSIGAYRNAATVDPATRTRSYAVSAYGVPTLTRPNVQILTEAKTHKVILEKTTTGLRATGVQLVIKDQVQTFSKASVFNLSKTRDSEPSGH